MLNEFLKAAAHPREFKALLKFLRERKPAKKGRLKAWAPFEADLEFCYTALDRVSRSFAAVIRQLPEEVRDSICIFYLVLRGLDTIEDDTSIPLEDRLDLMNMFASKFREPGFHLKNVGDDENYRDLMEHFYKVGNAYRELPEQYQNIILEITREMSDGMRKYAKGTVHTSRDYDEYCYYVAGLVGLGLTRIFSASGLEPELAKLPDHFAISMGLFLQKTNITRDILEDFESERFFWPEEIWSRYHQNLSSYISEPHADKSIAGLNHMVSNGLFHAMDCLTYLSKIQDSNIFRFCAIPQVMAMATLALMYENPRVFRQNVKIRKSQAVWLMQTTNNLGELLLHYRSFAKTIHQKLARNGSKEPSIHAMLKQIRQYKKEDSVSQTETVNA